MYSSDYYTTSLKHIFHIMQYAYASTHTPLSSIYAIGSLNLKFNQNKVQEKVLINTLTLRLNG